MSLRSALICSSFDMIVSLHGIRLVLDSICVSWEILVVVISFVLVIVCLSYRFASCIKLWSVTMTS